jgi:hypothetical protein
MREIRFRILAWRKTIINMTVFWIIASPATSFALMLEAVKASATPANFYKTTRRIIT